MGNPRFTIGSVIKITAFLALGLGLVMYGSLVRSLDERISKYRGNPTIEIELPDHEYHYKQGLTNLRIPVLFRSEENYHDLTVSMVLVDVGNKVIADASFDPRQTDRGFEFVGELVLLPNRKIRPTLYSLRATAISNGQPIVSDHLPMRFTHRGVTTIENG